MENSSRSVCLTIHFPLPHYIYHLQTAYSAGLLLLLLRLQAPLSQPTRLPCPWDSPSKKSGVGCHFLLQCMKVKSESEVAQLCPTLSDPMDCSPPGSSAQGIFQARVLEWGAIAFSISARLFHPISYLCDFTCACSTIGLV